ncbi:MAG: sulfatase [Candidatus Marinimicrobia bacterium]|jgi:arylsulfatase A-like enzyme|nr:sulfatase [Candidatus Neomarinimicrobiota bacterium]MDP6991816.1 sulfatase [Candidatus Neomarinimicrobiota bacterium]
MSNRNKLAIFCSIILGCVVFLSCELTASRRPNIIFIMSDDHSERAISAYGSNLVATPNIDRIAHEGVRFNNSFVTNSICAPSRAVLLTGKYSHLNGVLDNSQVFDGEQETFPKLLQEAGYETSMIGKWHLKSEPTGFDTWKVLKGQGEYYNPLIIDESGEKNISGYVTDVITDLAIETLNSRDHSKPFAMLMHHKAPHRNWMPNLKHLGAFKGKTFPIPETFYDDYSSRTSAAVDSDMRIDNMFLTWDMKLRPEDIEKETGSGGSGKVSGIIRDSYREWMNEDQRKIWEAYYDSISANYREAKLKGKDLLEWKLQRYLEDYLGTILSVDESVGRILDYLEENDLADNTIVIYTSDQGFYLGEHGWFDKRFMYEESLSMPLVMRYPKAIKPQQELDEIVLNVDFAPTLLDFAGLQIPKSMQGYSMKNLVYGRQKTKWRESMYYHYFEFPHGWHFVKKHYGIRTDRFKLIHFYDDIDAWEFYDLKNDPNELNNIYNDPNYESEINVVKNELYKLQTQLQDSIITSTN